jgi:hypothetical protein
MRTKLFIGVSVILFVLLIVNSASAQSIMKKDTLPPVFITSSANVNQTVIDAFGKAFKNAAEPKWFSLDKSFLVKFISNDQKNTALYNKKGYLIYHISYVDESYLPDATKEQIMGAYPKSKILMTLSITQNDHSFWIVNLQHGKNIVLAQVENDELVELDRFINSNTTL